jgi:thiol-disulfide isomerase/thioredoxin
MTANWLTPAGLHKSSAQLPIEGRLPSFEAATGWLNSAPLTPAGLRGSVVLTGFWTYTCVNWLRQLPYLRAWAEKYADQGLVVIGVHTPEFSFEHDRDNVARAVADRDIDYPVALDNDYGVWTAFANHYWPALYFADVQGRIRHHHYGEGEYRQSEMVIQSLLAEAGSSGWQPEPAPVDIRPAEAPADWADQQSAENYTGYERTSGFASPGGVVAGRPHSYQRPDQLRLNHWALSGDWTMDAEAATLNAAGGQLSCRFHARDLNLVMAPAAAGTPTRFRVSLDGRPPGAAHGADVDDDGNGAVSEPRMYQLIRQPGPIADATCEITFADPGAQVYVFTFG